MTAIFVICLVLLILSVWRRLHHRLAEKRFTYKVFALRDKLRSMAIDGVIDCHHWYFKYIDRSFSFAINDAYFLTLLRILLRGQLLKEDEKYNQFKADLKKAASDHPEVGNLLFEYHSALHDYLVDQHKIGYTIFVKPLVSIALGAKKGRKKLSDAIRSTLYLSREEQASHDTLQVA